MNVQEKVGTPGNITGPATRTEPLVPTGFWGHARSGAARGTAYVRRHPLLSVIVMAALVAGIGYEIFRGEEATGKPIVATIGRGNIENVVTAIGSLQPLNFVDVGAQVSGQLKNLLVMVGDKVQKGDLVAEIDSTVASAKVDADDAQLMNLNAQLADKQSNLVLTTAQADRQTRLKADNATSQDAYDSAQAALRSAQAQVKALQAQIQQSESTLKADQATVGYAKIYAPMAGTISSITAKQGQTLNANQQAPTILQVADLSVMTVQTQVSEADVPKLRVGMQAYFTTLGNTNRRWTGKLRQILPTPTVTNNVVLYTALFDVANPTNELMTQMTAQVFFILSSAYNVVTVPLAAVHYADRGAVTAAAGNAAGQTDQAAGGGQANAQGGRQANAQGARQARGQGGGQGGQGRRGAPQDLTQVRPRPATVTVMKADGTTETRNLIVGVADRVNAEIRSGLAEDEKVVVGYQVATTAKPANAAGGRGGQNGAAAFGGRGPGLGGFGGAP